MARFTQNTHPNVLRAALIDDDMDSMTLELVEVIAETYSDEFEALARRFLGQRWSNAADVWDEAADRGWFDDDTTTD